MPILLSEGFSLFPVLAKEIQLKLMEAILYKTGIVQLNYAVGNV